ncbi:MAG TPA: hypothetical protein VH599_10475 [Ktedonobacterales bacterium]|jgi:hypothetical protein
MQYLDLALSLAWPQIVVAILWFVAGVVALRYARATRRPLFLFSGIAALLLAGSEVLSPARLAYRYFTHRVSCVSFDACSDELLFGAAKFEWLIGGIAALALLIGVVLEVSRARRRAKAKNAARVGSNVTLGVSPGAGVVPAAASVGHYQAVPVSQPINDYGAETPDDLGPTLSGGFADSALASDFGPPLEDEQPTFYRRPAPGSGSGPL